MRTLRVVTVELLLDRDAGGRWAEARARVLGDIQTAILAVRWPLGSGDFTVHDQSGKLRGEGSGVKPIKTVFIEKLRELGWELELPFPITEARAAPCPGPFDAGLGLGDYGHMPFAVEWETGNISSSHRAINKIGVGLLAGCLSGGILVLPTRRLAKFLTDRIGNFEELAPYLPLWRSLPVPRGLLGVIAVEHDATSRDVPRIPKATNGRALI
jgi:hypothetical protein